MPKRPTGQPNAVLQPGRTRLQRMADDLLSEHGFVFVRRTGHGSNLYRHPDGRTQTVNGTPSNPGGEYARIKRQVRAGETTTEEPAVNATKNEATPVAQYVAMGDPFLLKAASGGLEIRARQSALAGWIKRVLERHGPVVANDLIAAAEQMGFTQRQIKTARMDAGAIAFAIPGEGKGRGRGGQTIFASLPHQMPENASIVGRPRVAAPSNGVAVTEGEQMTAGEAVAQGVETGEVAGFKVEHRGDYPSAPEALDKILADHPDAPSTPAEKHSEKPDRPAMQITITKDPDSDVAAAAFMLLESLGVKKPGDEAREALRHAHDALTQAGLALVAAQAAVANAEESLR